MFAEYSKCIDCKRNKIQTYNRDDEILKILNIFFPYEISIKILELSYTYFTCCYCKLLVCKEHAGIEYEKYGLSSLEPIILCGVCIKYYIGYV